MHVRWYSPGLSMLDRPLTGPSLFDDVFESFFNLNRSVSSGPRFLSRDTGTEHILAAELPGMTERDLEINVENGVMTVKGARKLEAPQGYQALRRERTAFEFSRTFTLSDHMDASRAEAKLDNGLLTIRIPHRPEAQPRQIEIKSA